MSFFCTFAHIDLKYYSCYLLLNCQMFRHLSSCRKAFAAYLLVYVLNLFYRQTDYNASVINESAKETFARRNEEKIFFLMHLIMWLFENKETRDVPNLRSEYYTIEMWRL